MIATWQTRVALTQLMRYLVEHKGNGCADPEGEARGDGHTQRHPISEVVDTVPGDEQPCKWFDLTEARGTCVWGGGGDGGDGGWFPGPQACILAHRVWFSSNEDFSFWDWIKNEFDTRNIYITLHMCFVRPEPAAHKFSSTLSKSL